MKKLLIVLSVLLAVSFGIYADKASRVNAHKGVVEAVAIADASSTYCAEVDSHGSLQSGKAISTGAITATSYVNTLNTACTLYGITFHSATAGGYLKVYDGVTGGTAGTWGVFKFEVPVGVAYVPSTIPFSGGLVFEKEIYVEVTNCGTGVWYGTAFYTEQ